MISDFVVSLSQQRPLEASFPLFCSRAGVLWEGSWTSRCHWPACVSLERVAAVAVGGGGGGGPRQRVQREHIPLRGSRSSTNTAPPERNVSASEPALLKADDSVGAEGSWSRAGRGGGGWS